MSQTAVLTFSPENKPKTTLCAAWGCCCQAVRDGSHCIKARGSPKLFSWEPRATPVPHRVEKDRREGCSCLPCRPSQTGQTLGKRPRGGLSWDSPQSTSQHHQRHPTKNTGLLHCTYFKTNSPSITSVFSVKSLDFPHM